ncbi:hypothetical protein P3T27_006286 [Kitasatospora sp. MAA19]|uniref:hypothetical protein n=1 Tax=unclassified Kitasatospora TaxID=2633591 RepID=UPI002475C329|nr:hypothetical protein [Kitasatospora sp. MAA19]MDH6709538.1 hypothetical protein [Kitasatospora sp. MAA19]
MLLPAEDGGPCVWIDLGDPISFFSSYMRDPARARQFALDLRGFADRVDGIAAEFSALLRGSSS